MMTWHLPFHGNVKREFPRGRNIHKCLIWRRKSLSHRHWKNAHEPSKYSLYVLKRFISFGTHTCHNENRMCKSIIQDQNSRSRPVRGKNKDVIRCVLARTDSNFGKKRAYLHGFNSCVTDGRTDERTHPLINRNARTNLKMDEWKMMDKTFSSPKNWNVHFRFEEAPLKEEAGGSLGPSVRS